MLRPRRRVEQKVSFTPLSLALSAQTYTHPAALNPTGRDKYPHAYNDYEHFSFPHVQAPYLESPVLAGGAVYAGGARCADGVVLGSIAEDFGNAVYCGLITHTSEAGNAFQMCKDTTMNVSGEGGGEVKGGRDGRRLRERIDLL